MPCNTNDLNYPLNESYFLDHPYPGLFIVIEGIDGSGKTGLQGQLADYLTQNGRNVVTVREPGGTPLGEEIRAIYKNPAIDIDEDARILLLYASRLTLIEEEIVPALQRGDVVIADRFFHSTYAMQCWTGQADEDLFLQLNQRVVDTVNPDLTLLLDINETTHRKRLAQRDVVPDTFDYRDTAYHLDVCDGYRYLHAQYAAEQPEDALRMVRLVCDDKTPEEVYEKAKAYVDPFLAKKPLPEEAVPPTPLAQWLGLFKNVFS